MQWHAVVLGVALVLSGCAQSSSDRGAGGHDTSLPPNAVMATRVNASASTTSEQPSAPPSSPAMGVHMTANVTEGTAPLAVAFRLDADDTDGVVWTLTDGSMELASGHGLPATVNATLSAGNHTVELTASTSSKTGSASLTILVAPAGVEFEPVVYAATVAAPCPGCVAPTPASAGLASGQQGVDSIWLALEPTWAGLHLNVTADGANVDAAALSSCQPGATVRGRYAEPGPEAGSIPTGALCLLAWLTDGQNALVTIRIGDSP